MIKDRPVKRGCKETKVPLVVRAQTATKVRSGTRDRQAIRVSQDRRVPRATKDLQEMWGRQEKPGLKVRLAIRVQLG